MANLITWEGMFNKIKDMSKRTLGVNHHIMLKDLAAELPISGDAIILALVELEKRGLVTIQKIPVVSVSLTSYGEGKDKIAPKG